jgi:hypothetical protein
MADERDGMMGVHSSHLLPVSFAGYVGLLWGGGYFLSRFHPPHSAPARLCA